MTHLLKARSILVALLGLTLVASCGTEDLVGTEREAACGRDVRFPQSFLEGPDQSRERFAATALGRVLDDFFMAGPGVDENDAYRDAEGFSPVSEGIALGYQDGSPTAFFIVTDGRVTGWGGCSPFFVEGDLESTPWHLDGPVDPAATTVALEVVGGTCGNDIITEVVRVDVTETTDAVEILVWIRETPFGDLCVGGATMVHAEARLGGPLGTRTLWNGGTIPATEVER